jgi:hypothetical protein
MYRCFACDSPAMMNCACHTQLERPESRGEPIVVDGVAFKGENKDLKAGPSEQSIALRRALRRSLQQHPDMPKKNIASGEDAIATYYEERA